MGKATGVDARLAEKFVALKTHDIPNIETYLLGADAASYFSGVRCVLQLAEQAAVLDTSTFDPAFADEVEHGITNAHPHLFVLVEVGQRRSRSEGADCALKELIQLHIGVIGHIPRPHRGDGYKLVVACMLLRFLCVAFGAYFLGCTILFITSIALDDRFADFGCCNPASAFLPKRDPLFLQTRFLNEISKCPLMR